VRADMAGVAQTAEVAEVAAQEAGVEAALQVQAAETDLEENEDEEADEEADEAEEEEEEEAEDEDEEEEEEEEEADEETSFLEAAAESESDISPVIAPAPRAFKFHPERIVEAQTTNKFEDPEMGKLNLALAAVKEDILSTNKQIIDERKWVIAVAKIIASYNDKMKRVEAHIIALRKEMKQLYKKKKQIENLKLQKALEAKLKEARDELATLTSSLKHVGSKQAELNRSGSDLRATIAGIQAQLAKLRGQQIRPRPAPLARRRGKKAKKAKAGKKAAKKCKKGMRFSKKAKKCVPKKAKALKKKL